MCDNEYKTRLDVWERLAGKRTSADLENVGHIKRGNVMEPIVEEWIRENLDASINSDALYQEYDAGGGHDGQIFLEHEEHEWIGGHPDGIGNQCQHPNVPEGVPVIYEIKTPTMYNVQQIDRSGLKGRYFWQVHHYMMITGAPAAVVVIWDYNQWTGIPYLVPAEPALHAQMLEEYQDLYFCAMSGILPEPETQVQRESQELVDHPELERLMAEYDEANSLYYDSKDDRKKLKGQILSLVGDAEIINTPTHRATIRRNVGKYDATYLKVTERDDDLVEDEYE